MEDTGATGLLDKANDAQVTLQGDAQIVWGQDWFGTEKGWGLIPNSTLGG